MWEPLLFSFANERKYCVPYFNSKYNIYFKSNGALNNTKTFWKPRKYDVPLGVYVLFGFDCYPYY